MADTIRHEYTKEPICPYCGYEFTDAWEFPESLETQCYRCDKEIHIERNILVTFSTAKVEAK